MIRQGPESETEAKWVAPLDEYNQALLRLVHPQDWVNPTPHDSYDLVVIGAGTAGLVTAAGAAGLGARVALVERALMGGDCLNTGCVPSKSLIHAARLAHTQRALGLEVDTRERFRQAMAAVRRNRAAIAKHDSAERFRKLGVDVFFGVARFTGPRTVEVGGLSLRFRKACIASGARAVLPIIDGLGNVEPLTNETLFNLTELPERLTILGGGPIGVEMAQAFQRLGSRVTLLDRQEHILSLEDAEAAAIVERRLADEGVDFRLRARVLSVEGGAQRQALRAEVDGQEITVESDKLLVAAGRAPNVEDLALEKAGVRYGRDGVEVDDRLKTSNRRVYACGDVATKFKFTHAADFLARIVIQNALFFGRRKASSLIIPWVTYTEPELAHVGMHRRDMSKAGVEVRAFRLDFADIDRSRLEEETEGFAEVLAETKSGRILGATVVHNRAGEMISEINLAMTQGIGLGALAGVIHPYPTQSEILRKLGDLYQRTRLTPFVSRLLRWMLWVQR